MRVIAIVLVLCGLASCSRFLEVRLFNIQSQSIVACSISQGHENCLTLASHANGVLTWHEGTFSIQDGECTFSYRAMVPESLEDYREGRNEPVNVVVGPSLSLLLVKRGQRPEDASKEGQPLGFPIEGVSSQVRCK
jgi:hypothetical protein